MLLHRAARPSLDFAPIRPSSGDPIFSAYEHRDSLSPARGILCAALLSVPAWLLILSVWLL
jgi:hypothetical protein